MRGCWIWNWWRDVHRLGMTRRDGHRGCDRGWRYRSFSLPQDTPKSVQSAPSHFAEYILMYLICPKNKHVLETGPDIVSGPVCAASFTCSHMVRYTCSVDLRRFEGSAITTKPSATTICQSDLDPVFTTAIAKPTRPRLWLDRPSAQPLRHISARFRRMRRPREFRSRSTRSPQVKCAQTHRLRYLYRGSDPRLPRLKRMRCSFRLPC